VNVATGRRVFLNDEVVVGFKETPMDAQTAVGSELGLKLVETLSAAQPMYVYRLLDPKNSNPFRVCQSLLALLGGFDPCFNYFQG
jgi:hypothetical protein